MSLNASVLGSYPVIDEAKIDALLEKEIAANNKKIVVLDDDPTGVQTVHDILQAMSGQRRWQSEKQMYLDKSRRAFLYGRQVRRVSSRSRRM
jgi:hypothetical protein